MALVKDHHMMSSSSSFAYNMGDLSEMGLEDGGSSSSFDKPMSGNNSSDELMMFQADDDQDSLIHFNHGSFLSFQQKDSHSRISWDDNGYIQTATTTTTTTIDPDQKGDWFYSDPIAISINADNHTPPKSKDATSLKRPNMGESTQALKKQCNNSSGKKPKPKSAAASKDPQSIAAKNRRERISERLKTLQELVPNGCKVDLVTMLEKAISYVKFLQVQVKVLATDEFWPSQGGKAPDISQVKEAIDAILSSQRDRNSSSSTN